MATRLGGRAVARTARTETSVGFTLAWRLARSSLGDAMATEARAIRATDLKCIATTGSTSD